MILQFTAVLIHRPVTHPWEVMGTTDGLLRRGRVLSISCPLGPGLGSACPQHRRGTLAAKPHVTLIPLVISIQPRFKAISAHSADVPTSLFGIKTRHQ